MKASAKNESFLYEVVAAILRGLVKGVLLGIAFFAARDYLAHRRRDRCDLF